MQPHWEGGGTFSPRKILHARLNLELSGAILNPSAHTPVKLSNPLALEQVAMVDAMICTSHLMIFYNDYNGYSAADVESPT